VFSGVITSAGSRQAFNSKPAGFLVGVTVPVPVAVREGVGEGVAGVGEKSGVLVSVYVTEGIRGIGGVSPPRQEANGRISNAESVNRRVTVLLFISFLPQIPALR
jgi:hypothetical protein